MWKQSVCDCQVLQCGLLLHTGMQLFHQIKPKQTFLIPFNNRLYQSKKEEEKKEEMQIKLKLKKQKSIN